MQFLLNLSIRAKIFSIALVGIAGFVIYWAYNFSITEANFERLQSVKEVYIPVLERLDANITRLDKIRQTYQSAVTSGEIEFLHPVEDMKMQSLQSFKEIEDLDVLRKSEVTSLEKLFNLYIDRSTFLSKSMIDGSLLPGELKPAIAEMNSATTAYSTLLTNFRNSTYERFTDTIERAETSTSNALGLGLAIGLIMIAVLLGTTWFVAKNIVSNLRNVVVSLEELTAGESDLTKMLTSNGNDEVALLVAEFNKFLGRLRQIIGQVIETSESLFDAARQLMDVTNITYEGSRRQHQEAETVIISVNEMVAAVQEVARNAEMTSNATKEAEGQANAGRLVVSKTIFAIEGVAKEVEIASVVIQKLDTRSQDVGKVLDVIRGIADQTNLLALNAAIEAARAGEQGRGFSIVADEVRTLSRRTQEATHEIEEIILILQKDAKGAVQVMELGKARAQESVSQAAIAGQALDTITKAIGAITDMSFQIAGATDEQTKVAEHINSNISSIRDIVQETSKGAERTAENSESLAQLAQKLQLLVGQFKL